MDPEFGKGKTVLVTGINGYIGSHIGAQFLAAGFDVRGTARTVAKGAKVKNALEEEYGAGRVEVVAVPDICAEGAFADAVKGVHAISHTASIVSFSDKPEEVIPPVIASLHSMLESAAREASVRHFIYTSSSTAAVRAASNTHRHITKNSWNDLDIEEAWMPEKATGWSVYGASKAQGENALWEWVAEHEKDSSLGFTVNAVLPATTFGPVICREEVSSTGAMVREVYEGRLGNVMGVPPQYYVSVIDVALLHVAPVIFSLQSQRIFAWASPFNWNDVLAALREVRPDKTYEEDVKDLGNDLSTVENEDAEVLLARMKGGERWVGLRECAEGNLGSLGL